MGKCISSQAHFPIYLLIFGIWDLRSPSRTSSYCIPEGLDQASGCRGITPSPTIRFLQSCCKGSSSWIRRFWEFPGNRQNCSLGLRWNKLYFVLHKLVPFLVQWKAVLTQLQDTHRSALPSEVTEPREAGNLLRQIFRSSVCCGGRTGRGREGQAPATPSCLTWLPWSLPDLTLWYQPMCQAGWGQLHPQSLGGAEARSDSLAPVCPSHSVPPARTRGWTKSPLCYPGWGNVVPHLANRAVTNDNENPSLGKFPSV